MNLTQARTISTLLAEMKSTQGTTAKKALAATMTGVEWKNFFDLVGNTNRQWNVSWSAIVLANPFNDGIEFEDIWVEAETRSCTPTVTAGRIRGLIARDWPENVLKAIVDKTLDAGLSIKEVLKSQGTVKHFNPSLAADWCDMPMKKKEKILAEHAYVSTPKMDGLRCMCILIPGQYAVVSRALKPLKNLEKHLSALKEMFKDYPCVIDGEILAEDWNETVTAVKKSGSKIQAQFYPFDLIHADEHKNGEYKMTSRQRHAEMQKRLKYGDESMFVNVVRTPVDSVANVLHELDLCLRDGWEGTVLHDLDAPYACKRSLAWVKVKEWKSADFKVVSFIAGTGKHTDRLGAFMVEGTIDDPTSPDHGKRVRSEVGTGFTDALREEIWLEPKNWLGAIVEIKLFELTLADKEGVHSLRFPSFLRRRTDLG